MSTVHHKHLKVTLNNMKNKQLMFAISNSLSKSEAVSFAQTMNDGDKYHLICVHRNPNARHVEKRERYVIVRDVRKGEIVPNGHALFVENGELHAVIN
jgi:hypothetical protein